MILQLRIYIKQNSAGNLYLNLTTNFIQTFIPRSFVLLCTNHAISLSKSMPMHAHAQVWTKQHIWYSIIIWSKIDAWSGEEDGEAKDEQLRLGNDDRWAAAHSDGRLHSTMTRATPELQPSCSFTMPVLLIPRASTHQAWRPHQPGSLMATTCARSRITICGGAGSSTRGAAVPWGRERA